MALPDTTDFPQSGSIVSRWKLDESSGTRADDVSTNDLTDNNTVLSSIGPKGDVCAEFVSANTEYLSKSDNAALSITGDLSVFGWISPDAPTTDAVLFGKAATGDISWRFFISDDGATSSLRVGISSNGTGTTYSSTSAIHNMVAGQWYHVGFIYDASAGAVDVYINGQLLYASTSMPSSIYDGATAFELARYGSGSLYYDGGMQDVVMWNVELTAAEAKAAYEAYDDLPATASLPQNASIVSRWKLDELSGTRSDSESTNDLTDNNTVLAGEGYARGTIAADFESGNSEYLSIADNASLSLTGDLTISSWVKFESSTGSGQTIAAKYLAAGNQRSYLFMITSASTMYFFNSSDGTDANSASVTEAYAFTTGQWYHVAVVYDASAGTGTFYVNGALIVGANTGLKTSSYDSTAPYTIGAWEAGASNKLDGLLQDQIIWGGVALTDAEVEDLYLSYFNLPDEGDLPVTPVSRWTLTEDGGTRYDSISTNHLTDNNTVLADTGISEANSSAEYAADFESGSSEYLSIADNASLSITGDMTIAVWCKWESFPDDQYIVSKYGSGQEAYLFRLNSDQTTWTLIVQGSGGSTSTATATSSTINAGTWYHAAVVYDASAGEADFYINGSQIGTTATGLRTSITDTTSAFEVGRLNSSGFYFDGQMQDLMIFNSELTAANISDLYNLYTVAPSTGIPNSLLLLGVGF